jgi:hypothetical protein
MLRICACSYSFIVHSLIKGMRRLHVQYFWPSSTCTSMRLIIEHETRGDRFFPFVGHVATHLRQNLIRMLSVMQSVAAVNASMHAHSRTTAQCVSSACGESQKLMCARDQSSHFVRHAATHLRQIPMLSECVHMHSRCKVQCPVRVHAARSP